MHSRLLHRVLVVLAAGAATTGSYFWLIGWDRRTSTGVNAYLSWPSHGSQLAVLLVVLGLVALTTGWVGHPIVGSIALAVALTACWALDAALNVRGDKNWPIGMTLLAWASFGGSLLLSGIVAEIRLRIRQRAEDARAAEQTRLLAEARAAEARAAAARAVEAARIAAEQAAAAARARAAAEAERLELAAAAERAAGVTGGQPIVSADRRAKVVQALRTSAAKVRAGSAKGRAKAS